MRLPILAVPLLISLALASCAGGDSSKNNNSNDLTTEEMIDQLELNMKEITCHHFVECPDLTTPYVESEAGCQNVFGVLADLLLLNEIKQVIASGDVEINEANYNACLYLLPQMECGGYYDNYEECRNIATGGKIDGDWCVSDFECASGYCNTLDNCPNAGVCEATAPEGAPCNENAACLPGLVCNRFTNLCGTKQAMLLGEPCAQDEDCAYGLSCVVPAGLQEGTCRTWSTPGVNCDPDDPSLAKCEPGTGCDPVLGQCRTVTIVDTDEACDAVNICDVAQREFCVPFMNTCTRMPIEGNDCLQLGMEKFCWLGHYCGEMDICMRQKEIGESCDTNEECLSMYCGIRGSCEYDPCTDPLATFSL